MENLRHGLARRFGTGASLYAVENLSHVLTRRFDMGVLQQTSVSGDSSKPFICQKCGTSYAQYASLWRHKRKCEGLFEIACTFCDQKFHRKDQLRDHLLSKHNYVDAELGAPGYTLNQKK